MIGQKVHSNTFSYPFGTTEIFKCDISGNTTTAIPLFNVQLTRPNANVAAPTDVLYLPTYDTYLIAVREQVHTGGIWTGEYWMLHHYSNSGILIVTFWIGENFVNTPSIGGHIYNLFCHDNIIYYCQTATQPGGGSELREININPVTLSFNNVNLIASPYTFHLGSDAASNPECCSDSGTSTSCYNIGDVGPEGGIIFSVPLSHPQNNGVNQTNYYYEVAQDDISIGGTPNAGFK